MFKNRSECSIASSDLALLLGEVGDGRGDLGRVHPPSVGARSKSHLSGTPRVPIADDGEGLDKYNIH